MKDRFFVDTNLWVYLYSRNSFIDKNKKVVSIIDNHFEDIVISTQVLGEIFNVLFKKGLKKKEEAREIILDLSENFAVSGIFEQTVIRSTDLSIRYGYSYWDSLIVASAIESGCTILFTEDMQHGQTIENTLRIQNPFLT
jgi:predicted nucleic acid-binding protein